MFTIGLILMGVSVMGLVGLAFMQARYPHALDSIMLPIEGKKATATATEAENPMADGLPQPDEVATIDLDDMPVNSINRINTSPPPPSE